MAAIVLCGGGRLARRNAQQAPGQSLAAGVHRVAVQHQRMVVLHAGARCSEVPVSGRLVSIDVVVLRTAAEQGLGIARLPARSRAFIDFVQPRMARALTVATAIESAVGERQSPGLLTLVSNAGVSSDGRLAHAVLQGAACDSGALAPASGLARWRSPGAEPGA